MIRAVGRHWICRVFFGLGKIVFRITINEIGNDFVVCINIKVFLMFGVFFFGGIKPKFGYK
jgi:hypothetical protein